MNDVAASAAAPPVSFTLAGAARGARAVLPIVPGAIAFGLVYGFLAGERGLSVLEIGLMSMLVFAGASQFLALELWGHPLPVVGIVLGVLVILVLRLQGLADLLQERLLVFQVADPLGQLRRVGSRLGRRRIFQPPCRVPRMPGRSACLQAPACPA